MGYVSIVEVDGYRWETGGDNAALLAGSVNLADGKTASSAMVQVADANLEIAGAISLPTKKSTIPIDIWLGEYPLPAKVFTGYVTDLGIASSPTPSLQIMATDKGKKGRRVQRARAKVDARLDELIRRVAVQAGLQVDLSDAELADLTIAQAVQMGETDWEFMGRLLEGYGHRMKVRGDTLIVISEDLVGRGLPADTLAYGVDIQSGWQIKATERTAATTPNVFDYNGDSVGVIEQSDDPAVRRAVRLERMALSVNAEFRPSFTPGSLAKAAKAVAKAKKRKVFTANLTATRPLYNVDTDDTIALQGFGRRFSGVYNVETLVHDLTAFTTAVEAYNGGSD